MSSHNIDKQRKSNIKKFKDIGFEIDIKIKFKRTRFLGDNIEFREK